MKEKQSFLCLAENRSRLVRIHADRMAHLCCHNPIHHGRVGRLKPSYSTEEPDSFEAHGPFKRVALRGARMVVGLAEPNRTQRWYSNTKTDRYENVIYEKRLTPKGRHLKNLWKALATFLGRWQGLPLFCFSPCTHCFEWGPVLSGSIRANEKFAGTSRHCSQKEQFFVKQFT